VDLSCVECDLELKRVELRSGVAVEVVELS